LHLCIPKCWPSLAEGYRPLLMEKTMTCKHSSFCFGFVALTSVVGSLQAQVQVPRARLVNAVGASAQGATASNPAITLYGGLATGDGAYRLGPALGASFNWNVTTIPFNFRLDPYFAHHSLDDSSVDGSAWFLGASGNVEFPFRSTTSSTEPYLFGGVGLFYRSLTFDTPGAGDVDDSGIKAGFGLGGGVRFGGFTLEANMRDIDEFTTISFLVGFMLGSRR